MSNSTLKQFIDGSWVPVIAGSPGPGIAKGGTDGQVLIKSGIADYSTAWGDFEAVINDLTPQLGGNLDLNSSDITGTGNINITGSLTTNSISYPTVDGTVGQVLTTDGAGVLSFADASGGITNVVEDLTPQLGGNLDLNGNRINNAANDANLRFIGDIAALEGNNGLNQILLGDANRTGIYGPSVIIAGNSVGGTGTISLNGIEYPVADGTSGQFMTTDGLGNLSFATVNTFDGQYSSLTGAPTTVSSFTNDSGYIANVIEDTTPQLGGNLDGQGNVVSDVVLQGYSETIHSLGTTDTPAIDVANGNVQSVTITAGLALPLFTNPVVGQSVTLLVSGSGTATGATGYIFAGGAVTLTTNSIITIFYDGTNYWTSISTDFQ